MITQIKQLVAYTLILAFIVPYSAYGADATTTLPTMAKPTDTRGSAGTEFKVGDYPGAVLMNVQLWGATVKTGSFDLPHHSDLATLVGYAGGPLKDAELDNVVIRRTSKGRPQLIKVDLGRIFERPEAQAPTLEPNDVIIIPQHKPFIDPDVASTVTVVSGIVAIILSAVVINTSLKK